MEGKTPFGAVIMGALILSLVLPQTQVEAKSCCKTTAGRNCYNACRLPGTPRPICAQTCSCKIISGKICPPDYPKTSLESSADNICHYCKLGCATSMCNSFSNLQNYGEEVVSADAVEQCTNACSAFCTKGSTIALESA